MSIRTTATAVQGIIEVDPTIDLAPFIETASALVDDIAVSGQLADTRLELVERWLSAHFYAVRNPLVAREDVKGVAANYQFKLGLNLSVTTYGQQAMTLDTTGQLMRLSTGGTRKLTVSWLGGCR